MKNKYDIYSIYDNTKEGALMVVLPAIYLGGLCGEKGGGGGWGISFLGLKTHIFSFSFFFKKITLPWPNWTDKRFSGSLVPSAI